MEQLSTRMNVLKVHLAALTIAICIALSLLRQMNMKSHWKGKSALLVKMVWIVFLELMMVKKINSNALQTTNTTMTCAIVFHNNTATTIALNQHYLTH